MNTRLASVALCVCLGSVQGHAIEVIDDSGERVHIERTARRIATLSPHATELVIAAGAGAALVGVSGGDVPTVVASLPRVAGPGGVDRERLIALAPDLVVSWRSGNRRADLDWIARSGIALYQSEPRRLSDIASAIRDLGTLSGHPDTAGRAAGRFEAALSGECTSLPRLPVYVEVWRRPSLSLGGHHWLNDALRLAGFRNVLVAQARGVLRVAPEAHLAFAALPQISLVREFDGSERDGLADLLSRPGPRLADAVQRLCRYRLQLGDPATQ